MFDIRNVAWLIGIDVSLSRSAFGVMWPRSKPLPEKSNDCTRYQSGGTAGSGRNVSTRVRLPIHSLERCQLTQFGPPRDRLYETVNSGLSIRKLSSDAAMAWPGLPIVRCTLDGKAGAVPIDTVNDHT